MSMGLAVGLIGLTSLALAILLVPLLIRRQGAESRDAYNLAVYRDQLAEVERDLGRGVLTPQQAEAARTEIGRRILALNPTAPKAGPSSAMPFAAATAAVLLVPFAAWALYAMLGSPQLPDQPYASRGSNPPPTAAANAGQAPHTDMAQAVQQLTAHLQEHPEDLTGWVLLARSQMSLGRYQDGAEAYKHALDLSNKRPDIWGDWGEAVVLSSGGMVTPEAKQAFEAGLKDAELAPRSRYYLALAQMQQGDTKGALQAWVDLEADSPADADWLPMVRKRIEQNAAVLGVDLATLKTSAGADRPKPVATATATPPPHPPVTPPAASTPGAMPPDHPPLTATGSKPAAPAPASAPDPQKVREAQQALAGASPQDRQAMINSMVERLAARLEQQPDDIDGWSRLARSYAVLNQPAKARDAYARAVKLRPDDIGLKQGYAEAIISAAGDDATAPPAEATALFRQILAAEPKNQMALWYVGLAEADAGHKEMARDLLSRLLTELPANAPGREEVEQRLAALKQASK